MGTNFQCSILKEGQKVIANREIGYRVDYVVRKSPLMKIPKGTSGIVVVAYGQSDNNSIDFNGIEVYNIPSYYLDE